MKLDSLDIWIGRSGRHKNTSEHLKAVKQRIGSVECRNAFNAVNILYNPDHPDVKIYDLVNGYVHLILPISRTFHRVDTNHYLGDMNAILIMAKQMLELSKEKISRKKKLFTGMIDVTIFGKTEAGNVEIVVHDMKDISELLDNISTYYLERINELHSLMGLSYSQNLTAMMLEKMI